MVIAACLYFFVALLFVSMTYLEGEARHASWTTARVVGLALCMTWPVLILFVAAIADMESRPPPIFQLYHQD